MCKADVPSQPTETPASTDTTPEPRKDVVLLHSPTEDGKGIRVIRAREGSLEAGEIRAPKEGAPIHGELVRLRPREDAPRVCDVEVLHSDPASRTHAGPARVATAAYRRNWEAIFSSAEESSPDRSTLN